METTHTEEKDGAVGRVVGLWRYPVKSMGAEPLEQVEVSWHGLVGDRRWAFVRPNSARSGFPWFTIRQRTDMSRYVPSFIDPQKPDTSRTVVTTPGGSVYDIADEALGQELSENGVRLIKQSRGVFDTFPLSLITTQTVARLGEMVGQSLDVQRFRPNILVEAAEDTPFIEDTWVGHTLRLGDVRMRVDQRDGRCVVITVDPDTGERSPEILRTVESQREGCLGVYGSTVTPGHVRLNSSVALAD
ncbi:MAG: MOSC N-terminal beta barrel domain-containing protein [Pseudomonadota bacterium]